MQSSWQLPFSHPAADSSGVFFFLFRSIAIFERGCGIHSMRYSQTAVLDDIAVCRHCIVANAIIAAQDFYK